MPENDHKAPEIESLLTNLSGKDRAGTIQKRQCTFCETPNMDFRTPLDRKEYRISGMCQNCQDRVFNDDEED